MIQCRLRELMASKGRRERRRITYDDIQQQTGVNKNTLVRLANDRYDLIAALTMDRLCAYFGCQPGALFVYVADGSDESSSC
jgi:putative transcriptional regulator